MNFNIYNSLILLGTLQGFIFGAVVLLSKKYQNRSMRYLSALILICSFNNLQYYLPDIGLISQEQMWETAYMPYASLAPTFIYFYVLTYLNRDRVISRREKLLYLPFVFFLLLTFIYKGNHALDLQTDQFDSFFLLLSNLQEVVAFLFLATVLIVCLRLIKKHQKPIAQTARITIKNKLNWLTNTLLILLVINLIYGYLMYRVIANPDQSISFYLLWISNSFLIYWLGHIGIYKYGVTEERKKIREFAEGNRSYSILENQKNEHIAALEHILVEKRRFLDSTINLDSIAKELNLSKSHLSRIINTELQTSFSDFVNHLRVKEAQSYLTNPKFANYTLVAIGLEAGFNSKTTFNNAFKKFTGLTPSQFKKTREN